MSDHSITIVPKKSSYPDHMEKAKEILQWLINEDIVKATKSDCILSEEGVHAISKGALKVMMGTQPHLFEAKTNGLEIITERQVFWCNADTVITCPSCGFILEEEIVELAGTWYDGRDDIICPSCNRIHDINEYTIEPQWAFGNLGFQFWNWYPEFTDAFLNEFADRLGCEVAVVHGHI